jgi:hypothetical protein
MVGEFYKMSRLMTKDDWDKIRFFHAGENWGDWTMMRRDEIVLMDYLRGEMGVPFIIHCAYESAGHDPNGEHPKGDATDGHFIEIAFKSGVDKFVSIVKSHTVGDVRKKYGIPDFMEGHIDSTILDGIIGRGLYPHWLPGTQGLHIDCRGYKATWGDIGHGKNHIYVSWNEAYGNIG